MHEYRIHTLVDITNNGNLKRPFPFTTESGDLIHDKHTLSTARDQNSNFDTMIQILQMRGNITWERSPVKYEANLKDTDFGRNYEGKATVWTYSWETEQQDIYNNFESISGALVEDFDYVPIVNFCKETVTFPSSTFITKDTQFKNTYFKYEGPLNK